jgi:phosphomannomutase
LVSLCEIVKQNKADIGFAQDPDADRLAIVDNNGNYIGEEYTLALACLNTLSKNKTNTAANLSTSRMIDDIAAKFGAKVFRTPVGEANVAKAMKENNCLVGGEGNGGVIDLRVGPIRNSLLSMAVVLELMAAKEKSISEVVQEIPAYSMIKNKFNVEPNQVASLLQAVKKDFPNAAINDSDGYRFDFADSWFHLRMSNTEPIMRVIAEANDHKTAQSYIDKVLIIKKSLFNEK